jgi:hypothetical protein
MIAPVAPLHAIPYERCQAKVDVKGEVAGGFFGVVRWLGVFLW